MFSYCWVVKSKDFLHFISRLCIEWQVGYAPSELELVPRPFWKIKMLIHNYVTNWNNFFSHFLSSLVFFNILFWVTMKKILNLPPCREWKRKNHLSIQSRRNGCLILINWTKLQLHAWYQSQPISLSIRLIHTISYTPRPQPKKLIKNEINK